MLSKVKKNILFIEILHSWKNFKPPNILQLRTKSNESTFTIAKQVFISSEIDFMLEQSKVKFAVKQVINWRSLTTAG